MKLLFALVLMMSLTVLPVMAGARYVNAGETGFRPALRSVVLISILSAAIGHLLGNPVLLFTVRTLIGAGIFAWILDTTLPRGLAIGVVVSLVQFLVVFLLTGTLFAGAKIHL